MHANLNDNSLVLLNAAFFKKEDKIYWQQGNKQLRADRFLSGGVAEEINRQVMMKNVSSYHSTEVLW